MSYLPCENPNCKSYGKPHPNCRCHGGAAAGGMVERYCGAARPHARACEYFAEGGEVPADDLPAAPEPEAPTEEVPSDDLTPPTEEAPAAEVPPDDLPDDTEVAAEEVPADDLPADIPQAPGAPGTKISDEEFQNAHKDYEEAFGIGSLITGAGAVGAAGKVAAAAAEWANLGKIGSGILQGAISSGLIQASDVASKEFLGEDQERPVASIIASAGLGGLLGGMGTAVGSVASKKLEKIKDTKLGSAAASFLAGVGAAANKGSDKGVSKVARSLDVDHIDTKAYEAGKKFFEKNISLPVGAATTLGAMEGYDDEGAVGAVKGAAKGFLLGQGLKIGTKVTTPVLIKILSANSARGIIDALNHFERYENGAKAVDKAVEGLFTGGARVGTEAIKDHKKLEDWLENGGIDNDVQDAVYESQAAPQGFAEGGEVAPAAPRQENGVAIHFPEQNVVMQAAKARAAGYLNSLRPSKHAPRLAFDDAPDDRQQKKTYKRALAVANQPLRVLDEIKRGTIEPDDIKHLTQMFPEVVGLLQKKLTERVSEAQLTGKRPSSRVRQGLSMLMGTALSSEFTPQSIQAAQAVFAQKSQSQSTPPPSKGDRSKLSHSDRSYLTDDQARMQRQQRQT
jgi:hypothetical protein